MIQVTLEQVHAIINDNDNNQNAQIASFSEVKRTSYSYVASQTSYHIVLSNSNKSYLLLVSPLAPSDPQSGAPGLIPLPALAVLLTKICDSTAIPVPRPVAHDVSGGSGKWSFGWLLFRVHGPPVTTSLVATRNKLSPSQLARVELRLGTYLRELHGVTNDWFGVSVGKAPEPPSVPSLAALMAAGEEGEGEDMTPYSWQDTFVLQVEELLDRVCGRCEMDVDQLRRSLSRAIGSFLFDDVEIPKLVWLTGNEEDVIVSLEDGEVDIAYIMPTFGRAVWGDPLMEAWFMPPGPSAEMSQGYFEGEEDGTLIVFLRHKTKRTWYTVYLALMILAEEVADGETVERERVRWARSILPECIEILKSAPCY